MYARILLPVDAAGPLGPVVRHAVALAKIAGATILGLRVIPVIATGEAFFEQIQVEVGSRGAKMRDDSLVHFARLEALCREAGVPFSSEVIFSEKSEADAIADYAGQKGCDLIILPTQPKSSWARWIMGNVADKIRRRAKVPVLFVPVPAANSNKEQ